MNQTLVGVCQKNTKDAVVNLESTLAKRGMQLLTIHSPMLINYHSSEYFITKLNTRGVQAYQDLIGDLGWAVEIGRVDIFL